MPDKWCNGRTILENRIFTVMTYDIELEHKQETYIENLQKSKSLYLCLYI